VQREITVSPGRVSRQPEESRSHTAPGGLGWRGLRPFILAIGGGQGKTAWQVIDWNFPLAVGLSPRPGDFLILPRP